MPTLARNASLTVADGVYPDEAPVFVHAFGDSPTATVRIDIPDENALDAKRARSRRLDTITGASIKEGRGGTYEITGTSTRLKTTYGLRGADTLITLTVVDGAGCVDCP